MLLGVISDTHDHLGRIDRAIELFNMKKVGAVIHCGDFVAPFSIKPFMKLNCPFYGVFGNNDGEREGLYAMARSFHGELHNPPHIYEIGGKRILVSHSPLDSKSLLKLSAPLDYVFYGHTHRSEKTEIRGVPAFNPGEACGWLSGAPLIGLLDLETGEFANIQITG